jgi:hypothetical protein
VWRSSRQCIYSPPRNEHDSCETDHPLT